MKLNQNALILEHFCKYVSSQFCIIDFIYQSKKIEFKDYNINEISTLIFPFDNKDVYTALKKASYTSLLEKIIRMVKLNDECIDIYRSEMGDELLELFKLAMEKQKESISISSDDEKLILVLRIPDFISDLYLPLLSQLHTEITLICGQFLDFVANDEAGKMNVFLDPKSATPYSRFIEMWVGSALGIFSKPTENVIVT